MALYTCVEYMSGQAVPKQFIHIKKHLLQEIPGNASATLHRSVATWWRNNSADREKKLAIFIRRRGLATNQAPGIPPAFPRHDRDTNSSTTAHRREHSHP